MTLRSPFRDRLLGDFHSVACPLWDPSLHNYFVDEPSHNPSFLATHCSPPYWSGGETRSLSILRPTTVCSMSLQ